MIDEVAVEVDGRAYLWTYDQQVESAEGCWNWSDPKTYMTPPAAVVPALNHQFIKGHAERFANELDEAELPRFYAILRSMGARDTDFSSPALELVLESGDPDKSRAMHFLKLPSAAHAPYNCPALRDWVFADTSYKASIPRAVTLIGADPFEQADYMQFLLSRNVVAIPMALEAKVVHDWAFGHAIVGRAKWNGDEIDELIEHYRGKSLRIYSQEMFVAMLHTGLDPFKGGDDVLEAFRAGHPALEAVSKGWAGWVTTQVPFERSGRSPISGNVNWQVESPLHVLGYRVGKSGISSAQRQSILSQAFEESLPNVGNYEYMQQWGEPGSPARLHKIADLLASNCRNMKNRSNPSEEAIADWEQDLAWLRRQYYHGRMTFAWPDTFV